MIVTPKYIFSIDSCRGYFLRSIDIITRINEEHVVFWVKCDQYLTQERPHVTHLKVLREGTSCLLGICSPEHELFLRINS